MKPVNKEVVDLPPMVLGLGLTNHTKTDEDDDSDNVPEGFDTENFARNMHNVAVETEHTGKEVGGYANIKGEVIKKFVGARDKTGDYVDVLSKEKPKEAVMEFHTHTTSLIGKIVGHERTFEHLPSHDDVKGARKHNIHASVVSRYGITFYGPKTKTFEPQYASEKLYKMNKVIGENNLFNRIGGIGGGLAGGKVVRWNNFNSTSFIPKIRIRLFNKGKS